ncbi:TonB system transport protein ExbD [Dongia rigui]|uniref:Biopolymer transport protein ExbD n=1 Tax=Dongia rigui TaxID=940149 RepID=A0ABU5E2L0_9PROT|nr:TonB system transport protein ExbD [Dongia rigui]MDY0873547.1 TonB system transport protein ExbD [Dongia rigui]
MAVRLNHGGDDELDVNHDINVTPFIDVILVLLIIFMVAAPLSTVDVPVDLPASTATPAPRPDKPVFLTIDEQLGLSLGNNKVPRDTFGPALETLTKGDKETRIFLRADEEVPYGEIMIVMNMLREVGYLKIALVGTETAPVPAQPVPTP